jgi:hypothetical protein
LLKPFIAGNFGSWLSLIVAVIRPAVCCGRQSKELAKRRAMPAAKKRSWRARRPNAVSLLNSALELIASPIYDVEVIVGELTPLLLDPTCFQLPSNRFQSMSLSLHLTFAAGEVVVRSRLARRRQMAPHIRKGPARKRANL